MKPTISLHGNGADVVLSNRGRFLLSGKPTGLGWGPIQVETSPRPTGGSYFLHRRHVEGEPMIPVAIAGDFMERREARRLLETVCEGLVEIRVTHPDGQSRSRFGYYRDGLEGAGEEYVDGEVLALSFLCPDHWWYGEERRREWSLSRVSKPYWTRYPRLPHYPAWLSSSTVLGAFDFTVSGDAPASPVWTVHPPGEDLLIECVNCGQSLFIAGPITEPVTIDATTGDVSAPGMDRGELWERIPHDQEAVFDLRAGDNRVRVSMVGTTLNSRIELSYRERWKAGH